MSTVEKTCFKCAVSKPRTEFYRHSMMADGYLGKCKECTKRDVRKNYQSNVEHFKEYDRARANLPHRVEARAEYAKTLGGIERLRAGVAAWEARNPIQKAANTAVSNAVRDGRLIRLPCEKCGASPTQGHHDDYSKPLDVRWLCTKHHAEWHRHNDPVCPQQEQAA